FTKTASTHASTMPIAPVPTRIAQFERSDRSFVHSLLSAFGIAATSSRRARSAVVERAGDADGASRISAVRVVMEVVAMFMVVSFGRRSGRWAGCRMEVGRGQAGSGGCELCGGAGDVEQDLFERAGGFADLDDADLVVVGDLGHDV